MPYTVLHAWYPPDRVDDVMNKYMEVMEKYPPDESITVRVVPVAVSLTKKGIEIMNITEVKPQKLEEALERLNKQMAMFHTIPDYRSEVKVWMTLEESLDVIGKG